MGWSGYGIYDGDETFSLQTYMLTLAGYKDTSSVPLRSGDSKETWDLQEDDLVDDLVLGKVYEAYPKIVKKFGLSHVVELNAQDFENKVLKTKHHESGLLIPLTMIADFFMRHGAKMPGKLQQNAVLATKLLIQSEHTEDFNEPSLRKSKLRQHMNKIAKFKPKLRYSRGKVSKVAKKAVPVSSPRKIKL